MTRGEIIKSALKFLVLKQKEQGSWGYSDRNDNEISWDKVLEWIDQQPCGNYISRQAADVPDFESEEYVEERIRNYDKMLKSGILDCIMEKSQESEDKE